MASPTVTMQAPASFGGTVTSTPSGTVYVPNAQGLVTAQYADVPTLTRLGFATVSYPSQAGLIGLLLGANMNVTTDQPLTMLVQPTAKFRPSRLTLTNMPVRLTAAAGGVFLAPAKGTTPAPLVAGGTALQAAAGALSCLDFLLTGATPSSAVAAGTVPILSLSTPQGAAATADLYLYGDVLPQ